MERFYIRQMVVLLEQGCTSVTAERLEAEDNRWGMTEGQSALKKHGQQISVGQPVSGELWQQALAMAEQLEGEGLALRIEPADRRVCQTMEAEEGTLYLTDCEDVGMLLAQKGFPVIAWLHEANRQSSFRKVKYAVECPWELSAGFFDRIYRRHRNLPWDIAETDRCLVRETTVEDVDAFLKIYEDPGITRYMDPFCLEPAREREYVRKYIEKVYEFYGYGVWSVVWKESGEVIGRVGFSNPGQEDGLPEMGYMIARPWQGKGIAREVCCAVLEYAKEELSFETVEVIVDERNLPSLNLAEKLDFQRQEDAGQAGHGQIRFLKKL